MLVVPDLATVEAVAGFVVFCGPLPEVVGALAGSYCLIVGKYRHTF